MQMSKPVCKGLLLKFVAPFVRLSIGFKRSSMDTRTYTDREVSPVQFLCFKVGTGEARILVDAGEGKPGVLEAHSMFLSIPHLPMLASLQDLLETMEQEGCKRLSEVVSALGCSLCV